MNIVGPVRMKPSTSIPIHKLSETNSKIWSGNNSMETKQTFKNKSRILKSIIKTLNKIKLIK